VTGGADTRDRTPNKIYAPWDDATVQALNHYQEHGSFHPFTCGHGAAASRRHAGGVSLVATPDGWHCPHGDCNYTQGWAWTFMARDNHSER
jgi:hypothetical protein